MNTQDTQDIITAVLAVLESQKTAGNESEQEATIAPPPVNAVSKRVTRNIERKDKSQTYNKGFAEQFRKDAVTAGIDIERPRTGQGNYKLGHGITFSFSRVHLATFDTTLADLRIVFKDRARKTQPTKTAVTVKKAPAKKSPPVQGVTDNSDIAALLKQNALLMARLDALEKELRGDSKTAVEFPTASETGTMRPNPDQKWVTLGCPTAKQAQVLTFINAKGDSVDVHDGAQFLLGKRNSTIAAAGALLKSGNNVNAAIFGELQRGNRSPLQKNSSANADLRKAARQALGILASDGVTSYAWETAGEGNGLIYQNDVNRVRVNYTQKTLEWETIA